MKDFTELTGLEEVLEVIKDNTNFVRVMVDTDTGETWADEFEGVGNFKKYDSKSVMCIANIDPALSEGTEMVDLEVYYDQAIQELELIEKSSKEF